MMYLNATLTPKSNNLSRMETELVTFWSPMKVLLQLQDTISRSTYLVAMAFRDKLHKPMCLNRLHNVQNPVARLDTTTVATSKARFYFLQ